VRKLTDDEKFMKAMNEQYIQNKQIEIAMEAGFNSRQHFTRVFTSLERISPQEYRREKRNSEDKQIFLF